MDHIPISVSGGKSIPDPFNENDVTVWTALICKYLCQNKKDDFTLPKFLSDVLEDKILPINAYNKEMIRNVKVGERNEFYQIISYCLEYLRKNRLLELKKDVNSNGLDYNEYYPTKRLRSICPQIRRVLMPGIKQVLEAEKIVRKDGSHHDCAMLLDHLKKFGDINKSDATKYVNIHQLNKLIQLGVVTLYLDGKISITTFGQLLRPLLS
jgi:hypothetical protein